MAEIRLKGMTWSHPRGYDPLVACAGTWHERTGVAIDWDKRSLQDFESYPVEELARRYDLIVIDHPHVGQVTRENCLQPFDDPARADDAAKLAAASIGPSWPSYFWQGQQWALPIDAATQVQAYRADRIAPATTWTLTVALARRGAVMIPMRPPHSLMAVYTLVGNLGRPCRVEGPELIDPQAGAEALEMLAEMTATVDPACFRRDPIDVFEIMAAEGSKIACAPLIYGYVSYAKTGFRPHRLSFVDIPVVGAHGPVGSALGGTGLAVSAFSAHKREAADFAWFAASGEVQAGLYAASGGQPAHAAAWEAESVNAATGDFYRATRATLDGAWLRPRHDGYMPFQHEASLLVNEALTSGERAALTVEKINRAFVKSFR